MSGKSQIIHLTEEQDIKENLNVGKISNKLNQQLLNVCYVSGTQRTYSITILKIIIVKIVISYESTEQSLIYSNQ